MASLWSKLFSFSKDVDSYNSQSSADSTSSSSSSDGLPSSRYRHTNWSDIPETADAVRGDQLKAPRVRQGPLPGDASFEGRPVEARLLHDEMRVTSEERIVVRRLNEDLSYAENWERAIEVNFSFQNLGDPYQKANFSRILRRLMSCQRLLLIDNHLTTLSGYKLPSCVYLVLTKNHLKHFGQLPAMPAIQHLCLAENAIGSLDSMKGALGKTTTLVSLKLTGNPVVFEPDYRKRVFEAIPSLQVLDGIPRRPSDRPSPDSSAGRRRRKRGQHSEFDAEEGLP